MQLIWLALQTDYSFLLRFLRFLTSAPLGFLPSTNLVDCVGNCYTSLIFSFCYFSYFSSPWNLKKLFFFTHFLLFSSMLFSAILFSFQMCFPFISLFLLLYSVYFSLMFYYYSLCSLSIICHLLESSI